MDLILIFNGAGCIIKASPFIPLDDQTSMESGAPTFNRGARFTIRKLQGVLTRFQISELLECGFDLECSIYILLAVVGWCYVQVHFRRDDPERNLSLSRN